MFFLASPLEQFLILPLFNLNSYNKIGFSITNETVFLFLLFFFLSIFIFALKKLSKDNSMTIVPLNWQLVLEIIYINILGLVKDNIKSKEGERFFPFVFIIFFFVLLLNLLGLIPFSFTLTSHLVITFSLSLASFIGINILSFKKYGIKFFSLFLPAGTTTVLALLLVPIELVSYIFKPISLSIRLFANLLAGHALLKVIAGFAIALLSAGGISVVLHYLPLIILIPLFGLELGVALIQSFVFAVLLCIYINDSLNISH